MAETRTTHCIVIRYLYIGKILVSLLFSIPLLMHMANWFVVSLSKVYLTSFYYPFTFEKPFCKSSESHFLLLQWIITFYCYQSVTSLFSYFPRLLTCWTKNSSKNSYGTLRCHALTFLSEYSPHRCSFYGANDITMQVYCLMPCFFNFWKSSGVETRRSRLKDKHDCASRLSSYICSAQPLDSFLFAHLHFRYTAISKSFSFYSNCSCRTSLQRNRFLLFNLATKLSFSWIR